KHNNPKSTMKYHQTFILFFFLVIGVIHAERKLDFDCDNIELEGYKFSLQRLKNFKEFNHIVIPDEFIFSICGNTMLPGGEYCGGCSDFGACQLTKYDDQTTTLCLGQFRNSLSDIYVTDDSITLTY